MVNKTITRNFIFKFISIIIIFLSSLIISYNSHILQSKLSLLLSSNSLVVSILKLNLILLTFTMTIFWIVIIYLIHSIAILFGAISDFENFFIQCGYGFLIIITSGIINNFFVRRIIDEFNLDPSISIVESVRLIKTLDDFQVVSYVGILSQFMLFIWFAIISNSIHKIKFVYSFFSSLSVLGLIFILDYLFS